MSKPNKDAPSGAFFVYRGSGDYRRPITKKRSTLALGVYPEVSLELARKWREEARTKLAEGIEPLPSKPKQRRH